MSARVSMLWFSLILGCQADQAAMASPAAIDGDASLAGSTNQACEHYQSEAENLRAGAESCRSDGDCAIIGIDAPCLLAFLCPTALNLTTDFNALRAEASTLSTAYRGCSDRCAVANCVYRDGAPAACNPSTHRCEGSAFH